MHLIKPKKAKKAQILVEEVVVPGWVYDDMKKDPMKICLVGDCDVGKKSIIAAMIGKKSIPPKKSIYDYYEHKLKVSGDLFDLELMEADAGPEHDRLRGLSYPYVNCFLVCYAINNRESLQHIEERWLKEIYGNTQFAPDGTHAPIILCGTKNDLAKIHAHDKGVTKSITKKEADYYAEHIKAVGSLFTSAVTKEGLEAAFVTAVQASLTASSAYNANKGSFANVVSSDNQQGQNMTQRPPPVANFGATGAKEKVVVSDSSSEEKVSPRSKVARKNQGPEVV